MVAYMHLSLGNPSTVLQLKINCDCVRVCKRFEEFRAALLKDKVHNTRNSRMDFVINCLVLLCKLLRHGSNFRFLWSSNVFTNGPLSVLYPDLHSVLNAGCLIPLSFHIICCVWPRGPIERPPAVWRLDVWEHCPNKRVFNSWHSTPVDWKCNSW